MLKALLLRRRIDLKKKELEEIRTKMDGFAQREADLTKAIEEVETEEQRTAMDEEIAKEVFNTISADKSDLSPENDAPGTQLGLFDEE